MRSIAVFATSVALAVVAFVPSAHAVPINYGDLVGIDVSYLQVTEDSGTDPTPLFGAPSLAGNSINFDPVSFNSSSTGAGGVDITDGTLNFMVEAKPNHYVAQLNFSEAGDFTLAGFGDIGTYASVTADLFINIVEVDGISIDPINIAVAMVFAPSDGNWDLQNDGPGPSVNGIWTGSVNVNLTQALIDNGVVFTDGVTLASVTLDNTLTTLSQSGTSSFIAKKDAQGLSVTAIIPEPSTALLLGLGLTLLGATRRRSLPTDA